MKFVVRTHEQVEEQGLFDDFDKARDRVRAMQHELRTDGYMFEGEINRLVAFNPKNGKRLFITINGVNPHHRRVERVIHA